MLRFPRPVQYLSASEDGFGWTMESAPHVVSYPALRGACVLVRAFWFSLHGTSLRTPLSILYCSFYDPKNRQNKTFARRVDVSVPPFAESDEVCKDADLRLAHQTPHQLWTEFNSYSPFCRRPADFPIGLRPSILPCRVVCLKNDNKITYNRAF